MEPLGALEPGEGEEGKVRSVRLTLIKQPQPDSGTGS